MRIKDAGGAAHVLVLGLGACSPSDFDDITRRGDAGTGVIEDASLPPDGGLASGDASAPPDAGAPAQGVPDAGATAACLPARSGFLAFCDDFEQGTLGTGDDPQRPRMWHHLERFGSEASPSPTAKLVVSRDGSRVLESAIGMVPGRRESARLQHRPEQPVAALHVELDFAPVTQLGDAEGNDVAIVRFQQVSSAGVDGPHYPGVDLSVHRGGTFLNLHNQTASGPVKQRWELGAPLREPTHVTLDVVLGQAGSIRVALGGRPPLEVQVPVASESVSDAYVMVGLFSEGTTDAVAHYDNVSISYPE